jgi:hypothetical protein
MRGDALRGAILGSAAAELLKSTHTTTLRQVNLE